MLGDARRRVGRDVRETGSLVAFRHDHDRVFHRAVFPEDGGGLGHGAGALADGAINAEHILAALVEDRVNGDGRFARLAVAEDQFALAAPDGDERVDDLETGLERHVDGGTGHDRGGGTFCRQAGSGRHGPTAIKGTAQGIDDTAEQGVAHAHIHDPARALDLIARVQGRVLTEQNDAEFVGVQVEDDAKDPVVELDQFLEADVGQTRNLGNAGADTDDRAHLARRQLRRERFARLADGRERAIEHTLQTLGFAGHGFFSPFLDSPGLDAGGGAGLSFSLRSSPTPFSSDAR